MGSCFSNGTAANTDPYAIPEPEFHPQDPTSQRQPQSTQTERSSAESSLVATHSPSPSLDTPVTDRRNDFDVYYERGKHLGDGTFATVFVGTSRETQKDYAVKCVDRTKMQWGDRDALLDEIQNHQEVKGGPNIVQLMEVFTPNTRECYLVMELLQGGELFDRILQKQTFTEKEARNVTRGLLRALHYMHSKRIAHRDLKPENLLLQVSL